MAAAKITDGEALERMAKKVLEVDVSKCDIVKCKDACAKLLALFHATLGPFGALLGGCDARPPTHEELGFLGATVETRLEALDSELLNYFINIHSMRGMSSYNEAGMAGIYVEQAGWPPYSRLLLALRLFSHPSINWPLALYIESCQHLVESLPDSGDRATKIMCKRHASEIDTATDQFSVWMDTYRMRLEESTLHTVLINMLGETAVGDELDKLELGDDGMWADLEEWLFVEG